MNKMAVTAIVTLALSVLAYFHVALPATIDTTSVVGVVTTLGSVAIIVFRFYHDGDPVADAKSPWASKTVWTGFVGAVFGVLAFFHIVPPVEQSTLVDMLVVGIPALLGVFGGTSKAALG